MKISDLTLEELQTAILALKYERGYYQDMASITDRPSHQIRADELSNVILALNTEIDDRINELVLLRGSDDESDVEDCSH